MSKEGKKEKKLSKSERRQLRKRRTTKIERGVGSQYETSMLTLEELSEIGESLENIETLLQVVVDRLNEPKAQLVPQQLEAQMLGKTSLVSRLMGRLSGSGT